MKPVIDSTTHKWCPGCKSIKAVDAFSRNHRNRLGRDAFCKSCTALKAKRYYEPRTAAKRKLKAELVMEFGNQCFDCKIENLPIDAFVFHHHSESMSSRYYRQPSDVIALKQKSLISQERKKWTLLCANCHSIRHGYGLTITQILN